MSGWPERPRPSTPQVPVTAGLGDMHNPLRMVLALTQPEDFVAIKIDIDRRARRAAPPSHCLRAPTPTRSCNDTHAQFHHCQDSPRPGLAANSRTNAHTARPACLSSKLSSALSFSHTQ